MPSLRRSFGILALLLAIFAYALLAVWLFAPVSRLHPLLQLPIWALLGVAWIFPAKPAMRWIETGRWTTGGRKN